MNMKKCLLTGVMALSFGGFFTCSTAATASDKHYTTVPVSLRGHWYHHNVYNYGPGDYDKLIATKYHFYVKNALDSTWLKLSGKKFPKYAQGHSQLSVNKNSKGYYVIGSYASDEWPYWKRVTHHGHAALRQLYYAGSYGRPSMYIDYWYRTKAIAKNPTGVTKNVKTSATKTSGHDLDYNNAPSSLSKSVGHTVFTAPQASADNPVNLATSTENFNNQIFAIKLKQFGIPLLLQKNLSIDSLRLGSVQYNGQSYYLNADTDIVPYNTYVLKDFIVSSYKPTDKSEVLVKANETITTKNDWLYIDVKNNTDSYYQFSSSQNKWLKRITSPN
mgnify:CR=1 FL=1